MYRKTRRAWRGGWGGGERGIHEISFELTKEISVRKGETCRALARKFARHTGGGFSPRLAAFRGTPVIERRETSPPSVYSQWKKGKSVIFPFLRSVLDKKAAASPFLREPYGKLGALAQKRGFACARNLF